MDRLNKIIAAVRPLDSGTMKKAAEYQASLAKPPESLGKLEELSIQLAGITGKVHNEIKRKQLLVFAADNGIVASGVSSAPQSVTLKQSINLVRGITGAAVLAAHCGAELRVCDVGINAHVKEAGIINKKIGYGTGNISEEAAMSCSQALDAIVVGAELAMESDADVLGIGEMGIGNTSTSAAVLSVLLGLDSDTVVGRGGGVTDEAYERKKRLIRKAIQINKPDKTDVIDILSKVGGFDIAAMCGAFIGAAASAKPVVIDGFISAVAALCAVRLCPDVRHYLIPSHASKEPGYIRAMEAMELEPMLMLGMRLGEGSGCPLTFQLLEAACAVMNNMATFEQASIDDGFLADIRGTKF